MNIRHIILGLRDQLPLKRLMRTILNGNIWGLLHKRSCMNQNAKPKIRYGSKESAQRAAAKMAEKTGFYFSNYRCFRCGMYHVGKNRQRTLYDPDFKP